MSLTGFFVDLFYVFLEVGKTLIPIVVLFAIFDGLYLKLPKTYLKRVALGIVITLVGLSFFLHGVYTGFKPVAEALGSVF